VDVGEDEVRVVVDEQLCDGDGIAAARTAVNSHDCMAKHHAPLAWISEG